MATPTDPTKPPRKRAPKKLPVPAAAAALDSAAPADASATAPAAPPSPVDLSIPEAGRQLANAAPAASTAVAPVTPETQVAKSDAQTRDAATTIAASSLGAPRFVVQAGVGLGEPIVAAAKPILHGLSQAVDATAENATQFGHTVVDGLRRFHNYIGARLFHDPHMGDRQVSGDFLEFWDQAQSEPSQRVTNVVPDEWQEAVAPTSFTGQLVSGLTRYGAEFMLLKGAGAFEGLSTFGRMAATSVGTQALGFEAYESRLSNMLQTHPTLATGVGEFMQADPTDNFAVAKAKQMVEGVFLDSAAEVLTFLAGVRLQRMARNGAHGEALAMEARRVEAMAAEASKPKPATVQVVDGQPVVQVEMPVQPPPPKPVEAQLAATQAELRSAQRALNTDELTGLGSNRAWQAARTAAEADPNTAILTFDLNNFKGFQDVHGHSAGDDALRRLGAVIQSVTNRGFRPHGDEFNVIVPKDQAESLRRTIEDLFGETAFQTPEGQTFHMSVSGAAGETFDAADAALPAAKAARKAATGGVAPRGANTFQMPAANRADAEATAATVNYEAQVAQAPRGALDEAATANIRAAAREAAQLNDPDAINRVLDNWIGNLNLNHFQTDAETNGLYQAVYSVFESEFQGLRTPISQAESSARAVALLDGVTEGNATTMVEQWAKESQLLVPRAQATRFLVGAMGRNVERLAAHADVNPGNAAAFDAMARALDYLVRTQQALTTTTGSVGRALNIFGTEVTGQELNVAGGMVRAGDPAAVAAAQTAGQEAVKASESAAARVYANMTQGQIRGLARLIRFAKDRPAVMSQLVKVQQEIARSAGDPGKLASLVRLRMNLLLSGPRTHATNIISNAITAIQIPAELWWSGVKYGERGSVIRGQQALVGLITEAAESFRVAKQSLESGANILDADGLITGSALPGESKSFLSSVFQAPTRLLMAEDEFFKVLNYRAKVRAESIARSLEDGITDAGVIGSRLTEDLNAAVASTGQALDPSALDYAKAATFTGRFETQFAKDAERLMAHPLSRLFVPFFRTPANIFKHTWERTPGLNLFNRAVLRDLEQGGPAAARRLAQVDIANAFGQTVMAGALSGQITGGGPRNPALRKQWLNAGNQPYSILTADGTRVSFRRADPLMTHVGLIADLVQLSGNYSEGEHAEMMSAALGSLVSAVSSKTFLQGLVQTADLFGSGADGRTWGKYLSGLAASTVVPSAVSQLDGDDTLREVRGLVDDVMNRTPGLSDRLEPARNLFGEPILAPPGGYANRTINPFTVMQGSAKDPVLNTLVQLGKAMPLPTRWAGQGQQIDLADRTQWNTKWQGLSAGERAKRTVAGELPQSPYDRMMELLGAPLTVDGKSQTLRQAMTDLVNGPEWKAMGSGTEAYPGGQRYEVAQRLIAGFTKAARQRMLTEFPLLSAALVRERTNAMLARTSANPQAAIDSSNAVLDSATAGITEGRATGSSQANDIISQLLSPYGQQ